MATATKKKPPQKPYPDFPLFPHASGSWAKKIRGKHRYFGRWEDPVAALQQYQREKDDWYAGRVPGEYDPDAVTIADLCNEFLCAKQKLVDSGERTQRHWDDLKKTCLRLIDAFGRDRLVDDLRMAEFSSLRSNLADRWAPTTLSTEIARMRHVFRFGYESGLLDQEPRGIFALERPSKKAIRAHRQQQSKKLFTATEIHSLVECSQNVQLTAFLYLGINCGFSNRDCAMIPRAAFDLDAGWVTFPRTKTAIDRRCPLWDESVAALRTAFEDRDSISPDSNDLEPRAFLTSKGKAWGGDKVGSAIAKQFVKLAKKAGCHRRAVGFYALRHTFATVGGGCGDQVAVNYLMGHVDSSIAAAYREEIQDDRLNQVVRHVRSWFADR